MKLSVDTLTEIGAFAGKPVPRSIAWSQQDEAGEWQEFTADTYVRRASCATLENETRAITSGLETMATRIASEICDENGAPVFTYEQAIMLNEDLSRALFEALIEVNARKAKS